MSDFLKKIDGLKKEVPDSRFILPGSGEEIFFKPFDTSDQKAMLKAMEKQDLELLNEVFDSVLRKCVTNEGFSPLDLYPRDRESLLIELRRTSVKEEYVHSWNCGNIIKDENEEEVTCNCENKKVFPLSELELENLEIKYEPKEVTLEDIDCVLTLEVPRRREEKLVYKYSKDHSKDMKKGNMSAIELLFASLASAITNVKIKAGEEVEENKNIKFEDKVTFVGKLSVDDRNKIRDFVKELEDYGFDLTLKDCKCEKCGCTDDVRVDWMRFFA